MSRMQNVGSKLRVLLVDGDRGRAMTTAASLRTNGWDVIAGSDAIQALTLALKERPDALVVSSQLPGGGGAGALKRLRSVVHTAVTPAIGLVNPGTAEAAAMLAAGAQECCELPADPARLVEAIRRHSGQIPQMISPPREVIEDPQRMNALA